MLAGKHPTMSSILTSSATPDPEVRSESESLDFSIRVHRKNFPTCVEASLQPLPSTVETGVVALRQLACNDGSRPNLRSGKSNRSAQCRFVSADQV